VQPGAGVSWSHGSAVSALTKSRLLSFRKHSTHQVMCAPLQRTHGRAAVAVMGSVDEITFFSSLTRSHTRTRIPSDKQGAMQSLMREQKRARGLRCAPLKGSSDYRCCETQPFPRVRLRIPPLTHRRALTSVDTVCVGMTPLHSVRACLCCTRGDLHASTCAVVVVRLGCWRRWSWCRQTRSAVAGRAGGVGLLGLAHGWHGGEVRGSRAVLCESPRVRSGTL
jgi:hypothetical protein